MRYLAWLQAPLERARGDKSEAGPGSRLQRMRRDRKDDAYVPRLPPLRWGEHFIAWLMDVGPTMAGGMGAAALTYSEICSWQQLAGVELSPWESATLRRLSREYAAEFAAADKRSREPPWQESEVVRRPNEVANDMRRALRAMAS